MSVVETKYRNGVVALLALGVMLTACGNGGEGGGVTAADAEPGVPRTARLNVVASTTIVADWVEQVGGDRVDVQTIVPASAEVHTFTLSPGAVIDVSAAAVVFLAGAGLEAAFRPAIEQNARDAVIVLSDGLPLRPFAAGFGGDGDLDTDSDRVDPHFWMDIDFVITAVERIRDALSAVDLEGEGAYGEQASGYIAELRALDAEIAALLADLPAERRFLVTFHDAYGYFADRYGLTVLGFIVEGPGEEPSAGAVAELVEAMRTTGAPFIYKEPQFQPGIVAQVASEAGAEVRQLLSGSLSDAAPTYIDLMRANAHAIAD